MATWTIDEEFARAHAAALRDLASQAIGNKMEPDTIPPVAYYDLVNLAEKFERAIGQQAQEQS